MIRFILILLGFLLFPFILYSEEERFWTVSLKGELPDLSFYLGDDSYGLDFVPNNAVITRIGIQYKNFGIDFGIGLGEEESESSVKTTYIDIQSFLYFENWGTDIYYQDYKGYYIDKKPISVLSNYPHMETHTGTVNVYYKLSGNRGLSAFTKPIGNEQPLSYLFFTLGSLSYRSIYTNNGIIPELEKPKLTYFADMNEIDFYVPSLSVGLLLSLRLNRFYLNPSLSIGLGIPFTVSNVDANALYSIKVNLKGNIGYEGESWGLGMVVVADSDSFEFADDQTIQFFSMLVSAFIKIKF